MPRAARTRQAGPAARRWTPMAGMARAWAGPALGAAPRTPPVYNDNDDPFASEDEDDEYKLEEEDGLAQLIDLTLDDEPVNARRGRRASPPPPTRNAPLKPYERSCHNIHHDGTILREGDMIEIPDLNCDTKFMQYYKPQFFLIQQIIGNDRTEQVFLRCLPYTRTKKLQGKLEPKRNEICLLLEVDHDDPRAARVQGMMDIELRPDFMVLKRRFWHTNKPFPEDRDSNLDEEDGALVCRWKYTVGYVTAHKRLAAATAMDVDGKLEHLTFKECTPGHGIADEARRSRLIFTTRGGSYIPGEAGRSASLPTIEISDDDQPVLLYDRASSQPRPRAPAPLRVGQKYTAADIFCGAGGASRGIQDAGIRIAAAVDHWPDACRTYKANFPNVRLYDNDVFDFITMPERASDYNIDILHMSPPCQYFSPNHTQPGRNYDANRDCLSTTMHVVKKMRPRVIVLEQTFGILQPRFRNYLNQLIQGFTSQGYSVAWKVINLATLGLPQNRRRFIMIGSCPGEPLPPFPAATHGPGLKPFVTLRDTLDKIPLRASHHNIDGAIARNANPYSPDQPFHRTITTGGAEKVAHWDGTRDYTLRELASINGFPLRHKFVPHGIKKQIGNAFPSCVVKVLYTHIRQWLEKEDNVYREAVRLEDDHNQEPQVGFALAAQEEVAMRNAGAQAAVVDNDGDVEMEQEVIVLSDDEDEDEEIGWNFAQAEGHPYMVEWMAEEDARLGLRFDDRERSMTLGR